MHWRIAFATILAGLASSASAQPIAAVETDCVDEVHAALSTPEISPRTSPLPDGRTIASLSEETCLGLLRSNGVSYSRLNDAEAGGVGIPIRLAGEVGGIRVASRNHSALHEIVDCRLAVALLRWAPELRAAGVSELLHYSTYRPGARVARTGRRSGHAAALAIDLAVLVMQDGSEVEVLTAWESRARGAAPCEGQHEESERSAALRRLVCSTSDLFQVVLTPHYDAAHANHVHLELRPDVSWRYVH